MSAVAKRYARAVADAAADAGEKLDTIADGFTQFAQVFAESGEIQELVQNPEFKDDRSEVLAAVLNKLKVNALVTNTIQLLAERDRLPVSRNVCR